MSKYLYNHLFMILQDEWMGGIKLNYNGGPFSKVVRFLKFKFLIILKLN